MKSSAVATQGGKAGALPRKGSLKASLDAVSGDPDAEDDFASVEELVVKKKGYLQFCGVVNKELRARELLACSC